MAYNEIQDALLDAMQIVAQGVVDKTEYDKSVYVVVTAVNGNKYSVSHNGLIITGLMCDLGSLKVGDRTLMTTLGNNKKILVGTQAEHLTKDPIKTDSNNYIYLKINSTLEIDADGNLGVKSLISNWDDDIPLYELLEVIE